MGKINAAWHATHRLGRHATLSARVRWHAAHEKHCGCRPMALTVRQAIEERQTGSTKRK
jgi:hypothetical protein